MKVQARGIAAPVYAADNQRLSPAALRAATLGQGERPRLAARRAPRAGGASLCQRWYWRLRSLPARPASGAAFRDKSGRHVAVRATGGQAAAPPDDVAARLLRARCSTSWLDSGAGG